MKCVIRCCEGKSYLSEAEEQEKCRKNILFLVTSICHEPDGGACATHLVDHGSACVRLPHLSCSGGGIGADYMAAAVDAVQCPQK
jgi:hypothetical protein